MSDEERHSDVDDVDIDEGVQDAVHDGPVRGDALVDEEGQPGRSDDDAHPASGSTWPASGVDE
jgi:hypothetical protein